MTWVLAWVFSFPVVFNSSKSGIKAAGAGTAAVGVCCPWGAGYCRGSSWAVSPWHRLSSVQLQPQLGERGRGGDLAPWVQRSPKFTCWSLEVSVLSASVEESGSLRSKINKNPVHQNQEPGMTWYVEGFGQGGVKGGSFVAPHSCLPRKSRVGLGFGFSCWIQYEKLGEIKAAVHDELLFLVRFWQNLDKSKDCVWIITAGVPWTVGSVLECLVLQVPLAAVPDTARTMGWSHGAFQSALLSYLDFYCCNTNPQFVT